jgi:hypothetical protein
MERHCLMLSSRNLSVTGRALVANSLLSAKLRHVLRVVVAPHSMVKTIYTVDTLCLSIWIQAFMEYDLLPQEPWWCGSGPH